MRNGEEVYCRREAPLGSRLPTALHCVTVAEAELMAQQGRETTEHLQHDTAGLPLRGARRHLSLSLSKPGRTTTRSAVRAGLYL
jgi:hypothetical protein